MCGIAARTHLSQPAVSRHLKLLYEAGLLSREKVGTMNFYRPSAGREEIAAIGKLCESILAALDQCEKGENA